MFNLLDRLDKVNIKSTIVMCLEQSQYEIIAFNRGQLHAGQDNTGGLIDRKYKRKQYALFKEELNPVPGYGTPDLYVSGNFYNGIGVVVNSSQWNFTISSSDSKAPKLELKYSTDIYGLDPENTEYLSQEIIKPKIIDSLRNQLGL